ncbi:hypothetical protein ES319_A13G091900v1 [Gossypium barbadense]|uniref:Uncharacterized protein n=1 Tax=Gossypium barbadense TaxID=3634 RepID=A0A5J5SXE6_GOSBA|nr:hypothetical protein ES319_A13G091900v1 [Gossypium barbadense]
MIECSVCHSKIASPPSKTISRAYDRHRSHPMLVYMSKVDGGFKFSPISVNFLTEVAKVIFAITMLLFQAQHKKFGEKSLLSISSLVQHYAVFNFDETNVRWAINFVLSFHNVVLFVLKILRAARNNVLLAVPALLYAINNYLKFVMQFSNNYAVIPLRLYFNPATVKMLSNLKVLVIAVLLKMIMKQRFSIIQWEALALLLIGISINQLQSLREGTTSFGLMVATGAYLCTLIFVSY